MIVHEIRGIHSVYTKMIQIIFSLSQTCLAVLDWTFSVLLKVAKYKSCIFLYMYVDNNQEERYIRFTLSFDGHWVQMQRSFIHSN